MAVQTIQTLIRHCETLVHREDCAAGEPLVIPIPKKLPKSKRKNGSGLNGDPYWFHVVWQLDFEDAGILDTGPSDFDPDNNGTGFSRVTSGALSGTASGDFDGTLNGWLERSELLAHRVGDSPFTIDFEWELDAVPDPDATGNPVVICGKWESTSEEEFQFRLDGDGAGNHRILFDYSTDGITDSTIVINLGMALSTATEYDVAFQRIGDDIHVHIDGTHIGSAALPAGTTIANDTAKFRIGANAHGTGNVGFDGRVDNFRFTVRYARFGTSNYNKMSSDHYDGGDLWYGVDTTRDALAESVWGIYHGSYRPHGMPGPLGWRSAANSTASDETAAPYVGDRSTKFTAIGNEIGWNSSKSDDVDGLDLAGSDFTIEIAVKDVSAPAASASSPGFLLSQWDFNTLQQWKAALIGDGVDSHQMRFVYSTTGSNSTALTTTLGVDLNNGSWHNLCWERHGNDLNFYHNGSLVGTHDVTGVTIFTAGASGPSLAFGDVFVDTGDDGFVGKFDEVRITMAARYKGNNYTPSTTEFPG